MGAAPGAHQTGFTQRGENPAHIDRVGAGAVGELVGTRRDTSGETAEVGEDVCGDGELSVGDTSHDAMVAYRHYRGYGYVRNYRDYK